MIVYTAALIVYYISVLYTCAQLLEKGPLYRGMFFEFSELKLVDQLQTILEKFTEFEK